MMLNWHQWKDYFWASPERRLLSEMRRNYYHPFREEDERKTIENVLAFKRVNGQSGKYSPSQGRWVEMIFLIQYFKNRNTRWLKNNLTTVIFGFEE